MYESDEEEEEGVNSPGRRFGSTWILPLREQMATPTKIQVRKKIKQYCGSVVDPEPLIRILIFFTHPDPGSCNLNTVVTILW